MFLDVWVSCTVPISEQVGQITNRVCKTLGPMGVLLDHITDHKGGNDYDIFVFQGYDRWPICTQGLLIKN